MANQTKDIRKTEELYDSKWHVKAVDLLSDSNFSVLAAIFDIWFEWPDGEPNDWATEIPFVSICCTTDPGYNKALVVVFKNLDQSISIPTSEIENKLVVYKKEGVIGGKAVVLGVVADWSKLIKTTDQNVVVNATTPDLFAVSKKDNSLYFNKEISQTSIYTKALREKVSGREYLTSPLLPDDNNNQTHIDAFKCVIDVWFESLVDSQYEDYTFAIKYIGKNDASFQSIFWLQRTPSGGGDAEYKKIVHGGSKLLGEGLIYIPTVWDGVTIKALFDRSLMPINLVDLYSYPLAKRDSPSPLARLSIETEKLSSSQIVALETPPMKLSIVLSGSSITWGSGSLGDCFDSKVLEFLRHKLSTTLLPDVLTYNGASGDISNSKIYKGIAKSISGLGSKIEFDLVCDELAICQVIQRTSNYGEMTVKADGSIVAKFTNHNKTLGNEVDNFLGNGNDLKFMLAHPHTYNHNITINGSAQVGQVNSGGYGGVMPDGKDYLVYRKMDADGGVKHVVWFRNAPANGAVIVVSYDYGKMILHERSTVGQLDDGITNESNYGEGSVSFDPANPASISSGLEFRSIDKDSFFIHKFTDLKNRHIEIEITGGVNPYFSINFASNRFHNLMNAGIGGWSIGNLINNDGINDFNNLFKSFIPDVIINESATNDDWMYGNRKISRSVSGLTEAAAKALFSLEIKALTYISANNFRADLQSGIIDSIDQFSLVCSQIVGSDVVAGDIVRIGNYHGDNRQVVVREIESVDLAAGKITWLMPLNSELILNIDSIDDLIGSEVAIRDLSGYQVRYEELIEKLQKSTPQTQLLVTQAGLSNYHVRQLWGYDIIHRRLAVKYHNVNTIEVTNWLQDFQENSISGNSFEEIVANNSDEYTLAKDGHWQGFKVWVNGRNVYGDDCYIQQNYGYKPDPNASGADINIGNPYNKEHTVNNSMKLVFAKNKPLNGTIRIEYADGVWSSDYCHTNSIGYFLYGQAYASALKAIL